MSTVLVVDNADVAFLFALATRLPRFEIRLIPADSVEQAHLLREHIGPLDLLILNCSVPHICPFAVITAHTASFSSVAAAMPNPAGIRVNAWRSSLRTTLRVIGTMPPQVVSA